MSASFVRRLGSRVTIPVLLCMLAASAGALADGPAEKELLAIQQQWAKARIDQDVKFLERLYAKEFWITAMNGSRVTRAEDIGVFASGDMKPEHISDHDMNVTVYPDFAIVTGREHVKGTYKGMAGDYMLAFTNVYVRRDGRWQMVTHHSTPLPKR
jgi:ketosteroid isomerase-like protein